MLARQRGSEGVTRAGKHRDEAIAGLVGGLFGRIECARQLWRKINLSGATSGNFWQFVERVLGRFEDSAGIAAGTVNQTSGKTF